jgi:hypothetical protein
LAIKVNDKDIQCWVFGFSAVLGAPEERKNDKDEEAEDEYWSVLVSLASSALTLLTGARPLVEYPLSRLLQR